MLRQISEIKNFALATRDGEIGTVKELYFDDEGWVTRYLVVDTGGWLAGHQVLISPQSLGAIDEEKKTIAISLTKSQVENSPSIETDKPVTRQYEEAWHQYYGYPGYWMTLDAAGFVAPPPPATDREPRPKGDPHLRSTSEVTGYSIHATNGDIGHVDDFVVDDEDWVIRYVVISRSWLPEKKVILATEWTDQVSWEERKVFVPLTREAIKDAPEWDDAQPITRAFESRLHDYYGRQGYWPIDV